MMWKIFFEYPDESKCTLTGKHKDIPLRLAVKYHSLYGVNACKSIYQQYPKKEHEPIELSKKIEELVKERVQSGWNCQNKQRSESHEEE